MNDPKRETCHRSRSLEKFANKSGKAAQKIYLNTLCITRCDLRACENTILEEVNNLLVRCSR